MSKLLTSVIKIVKIEYSSLGDTINNDGLRSTYSDEHIFTAYFENIDDKTKSSITFLSPTRMFEYFKGVIPEVGMTLTYTAYIPTYTSQTAPEPDVNPHKWAVKYILPYSDGKSEPQDVEYTLTEIANRSGIVVYKSKTI